MASTEKWRPTSIGAGTVRKATTTSPDSTRPWAANSRSGAQLADALDTKRVSAPATPSPMTTRRDIMTRPTACGRGDPSAWLRPRPAEQRLTVLPGDPLGHVGRQVGEPGARPRGVLRHVVPALGHEGVGADHEAVGELEEGLPPLRGHLAARCVVAAEGEVRPEVAVLAQHFADAFRRFEARMRPQDPRVGVLLEQ